MSQRARQRRDRSIHRRSQGRLLAVAVVATAFILGGAALLASALGSDDGSDDGSGSGKIRVSMTEFAFSPDPIVVPKDQADAIEVVNEGMVNHNLLIAQLGKGAPDLAPGTRFVLDLSSQPAGRYRVVCDLPGHTEAGMVTELILQ